MDDFLQLLRKDAVYFKLASNEKVGGAVKIDDVIKVLKSLTESYLAFVETEYSKISNQGDRRKLNKIKKGLQVENNLMLVDLEFKSCGMAISPNVITYNLDIPQIEHPKIWKKEVFTDYKDTILKSDYNNGSTLKKLAKRFNPVERQRIFKPLIDGIINNELANTTFAFGESDRDNLKPLSVPKTHSYSILVPKPTAIKQELVEVKKSMAMVEIKNNRATPKILELFEEVMKPVYLFNEIPFNGTNYNLKFPIPCELIHEDDVYILENKSLGIMAFGQNITEAQKSFFEEFDYIYKRYNSLPDSDLSSEVITIKDYLNLIVL